MSEKITIDYNNGFNDNYNNNDGNFDDKDDKIGWDKIPSFAENPG